MKRRGDKSTVSGGLVLGNDGAGALTLLPPHSVLLGTVLDCQMAKLLDVLQGVIGQAIPGQPPPRRQWQRPTSLPVSPPDCLFASPSAPFLEANHPEAECASLLAEGTLSSTLLRAPEKVGWIDWQLLRRLVSLSGLGWAFVLAAVGWEFFAYAFSRCAGWGWDRGGFFFAWGLGMLAFGFFLRTSRKRPAVSRLFLGVNILLVSVLSLVVATR